jgi:hypothetical protein
MNLIVLIWGALPHKPKTIPRYWWPVTTILVFVGAGLYWLVFWVLLGTDKSGTTRGEKIGFEIVVHNETDPDVPGHMRVEVAQSRLDGSRRRTEYKVCSAPG